MALLLLILLRLFFLLVTQGYNISLGFSLTPYTNSPLLSPSGLFAFGFYQQDDDDDGFMVGIWLVTKPEITVVWIANRDDPVVSSNSTMKLTRDGWLLLNTNIGEDKMIISPTYWPVTSASLLDTGNFQLYSDSDVIWESFKYPCDTILAGQKLGPGDELVSGVSASQVMSGNFVLAMQDDGYLVAYPRTSFRDTDDSYWATVSDNNQGGSVISLYLNDSGSLILVEDGIKRKGLNNPSPSNKNERVIFRATLNWDGNFVLYSHRFINSTSTVKKEWEALMDPCEVKGICGPNSYCVTTAPSFYCHCFPGFFFPNETSNTVGKSHGCYRNFTDQESCTGKTLKLSYNITRLDSINLPQHFFYSVLLNLSKEVCGQSCVHDCNCWASLHGNDDCKLLKPPILYAVHNKSISSTLFIKTSFPYDPPLPTSTKVDDAVSDTQKLVHILAIALGCVAFICTVMAFSAFFFYRVHAHTYQSISEHIELEVFRDHFTLRAFSFDELKKATDGFKEVIGREVYKGFISEGKKAVAVKRLERMFDGEGWFRAEITAIAQTHHRNLVGLLGFCIYGSTKLLVYEFMSNRSLADLLFNTEKPPGWQERVKVALDVARGILYLHEECETRIIHCNITPSNILFDEFWTAKISDFGLSKLLRSNQSGTIFTGDRGTRGYLAPEWNKNTLISTKVDVYSFGVVLLEILCCRNDMEIDVLSTWVYNCFVDKDWDSLVGIGDEEVDVHMLEKMVKVGLLCIQDDPDARPSIKNVVMMLEGTTEIPISPSPSPSFPTLI